MKPILLVPSVRRGNGSGHLTRCLALATALGSRARVYLADDPGPGCWSAGELRLAYPVETAGVTIQTAIQAVDSYQLIVLDQRITTTAGLADWMAHGPVAAIDEGGPARSSVTYLLDILPRRPLTGHGYDEPNCADLGFLALPGARRESAPRAFKRILVSFGGEDPAKLAPRFIRLAMTSGLVDPAHISVVTGPLASMVDEFPAVTTLGPVQNLKEHLRHFDLVVTQFGLTAFEAAWAGCAVLLLNPSLVHQQLGRLAGFASLGVIKPGKRTLTRWLGDPAGLVARSQAAAPKERVDLAAHLRDLQPWPAGHCPACKDPLGEALFRNPRKTYLRCRSCGLIRMVRFDGHTNPYTNTAYFFDEYKAQYGRTYIDDIPNIRKAGARRLAIIEDLLDKPAREASLLDVGCAYGAFVAEAQTRGWNPVGSDIADDAVRYVRNTFGVPAFTADFAADVSNGLYPRNLDCLTMWYVLEHFEQLARVLQRTAALLRPGGIFAFSTPSCTGISAKYRPRSFWEASPDDHCTVWDPVNAGGILKRFGFTVQRIVVTGHHPERFPGIAARPASAGYMMAMAVSRAFRLGDTFECYAVRDDAP
jgi:SAM-dependent methyltransferase